MLLKSHSISGGSIGLGCLLDAICMFNCCLRSSLSVNHRVVLFSHLAQHMASLADAWGSYISLLTQLVLLVTLAPNIHLKLMIQLAHLACVFSCCCQKKKKNSDQNSVPFLDVPSTHLVLLIIQLWLHIVF